MNLLEQIEVLQENLHRAYTELRKQVFATKVVFDREIVSKAETASILPENRTPIRDLLRCGDCGDDRFSLFHARHDSETRFGGDPGGVDVIIVRCLGCNDETTLGPKPSKIVSDGNLVGGWKR